MDNLPNSMSASELVGWRKLAKQASNRARGADIVQGLNRSEWQPIQPVVTNRSPYQSCSSCRRIRNV